VAGQTEHEIMGDGVIALKISHLDEKVADTKRELAEFKTAHSDALRDIKSQIGELAIYHKQDHDQLTKLQGKIDKVESAVIQSIQSSESRSVRLESLINEKIELTLKTQTIIEGHLLEKISCMVSNYEKVSKGLDEHMDEEMTQRKQDNDKMFGFMRDIKKDMDGALDKMENGTATSLAKLRSNWWNLMVGAVLTLGTICTGLIVYIWQTRMVSP
jgi:hypothetical protein